MSQQIILQTELSDDRLLLLDGDTDTVICTPGLYCIWGAQQKEFIAFNLTKDEVVEYFLAQSKNEITRKVLAACHELQCGEKPYAQFTKTFAEAIHTGQQTHGLDNYEFEKKEKKGG